MTTHLDGEARAISSTQHGIITRAQALAIGMTDDAIYHRARMGAWKKITPGVFLIGGVESPLTLLAAATVRLPAVVSHQSAARIHGLSRIPSSPPSVTVPHRLTNRFHPIVVHESTDLRAEWVVDVANLPTTSVPRTLFDLGAVLDRTAHTRVLQQALIDNRTTLADLGTVLSALGRRGRPGTAALREFLETADDTLEAVESELERRFVELLRRHNLPRPDLQADLPWRAGVTGRVDFLFERWRLIVEVDGRTWHATAEAFTRDRQRDNLAQVAGYRVLRFTWGDITERPFDVVRQLRGALRQADAA